tara:strand:- start:771 stop:899 length:129 start_codon:yes stop_codon:yes gene_type:complete
VEEARDRTCQQVQQAHRTQVRVGAVHIKTLQEALAALERQEL